MPTANWNKLVLCDNIRSKASSLDCAPSAVWKQKFISLQKLKSRTQDSRKPFFLQVPSTILRHIWSYCMAITNTYSHLCSFHMHDRYKQGSMIGRWRRHDDDDRYCYQTMTTVARHRPVSVKSLNTIRMLLYIMIVNIVQYSFWKHRNCP